MFPVSELPLANSDVRREESTQEVAIYEVRTRGTPTRLEIHRLKYNQAGRRGTSLNILQLSDVEKDILNSEILQDVRVQRIDFTGDMDEQIFNEVQARVFAEWGVMCPHPGMSALERSTGQECPSCGALVMPKGWQLELQMKLER